MTGEAILREDGAHIAVELELCNGRSRNRKDVTSGKINQGNEEREAHEDGVHVKLLRHLIRDYLRF